PRARWDRAAGTGPSLRHHRLDHGQPAVGAPEAHVDQTRALVQEDVERVPGGFQRGLGVLDRLRAQLHAHALDLAAVSAAGLAVAGLVGRLGGALALDLDLLLELDHLAVDLVQRQVQGRPRIDGRLVRVGDWMARPVRPHRDAHDAVAGRASPGLVL